MSFPEFLTLTFVFFTVLCRSTSLAQASNWHSRPDIQSRIYEDDELDGHLSVYIHHSFEPIHAEPIYTPRGIITIHPSKHDQASYYQEHPLLIEDVEKLRRLAESNDIYRVKIQSKPGEQSNNSVFSFTKACAIYESGLTDNIAITLDQTGSVVGIGISAVYSHCSGDHVPDSKLTMFNTSVNVISLVSGPAPDTLTYIQRLEQEKAEKARGEQGDNRSFFSKYWMYFLPFLIFFFISGASNPEGQASGR